MEKFLKFTVPGLNSEQDMIRCPSANYHCDNRKWLKLLRYGINY